MKLPKLQIIIWWDCTHLDSTSLSERDVKDESLIEMHTVGFVVCEDKEKIVVAMEWIPEQEQFRHITWVPKVNIVKRHTVYVSH